MIEGVAVLNAEFGGDRTSADNEYWVTFEMGEVEMVGVMQVMTMVRQKLWIYIQIDRDVFALGVAQLNGLRQNNKGEYRLYLLSNVASLKLTREKMSGSAFVLYIANAQGIPDAEAMLGIDNSGYGVNMVNKEL